MALSQPTVLATLASNANASSYATAGTFTIGNGHLGLALVSAETAQADGNPTQPTFTANGETWDVVGDLLYDGAGGTRGRMTIFRIMGTALTTTVGTADFGVTPIVGCEIIVLECAGSIETGARGANAIRQVAVNAAAAGTIASATLPETPWVKDGTVLFSASNSQNVAVAAGGGATLLQTLNHSGPNANAAAVWVAPDGAAAMSSSWVGNADWGAIVIELQEATALPPGGVPSDLVLLGELYDSQNLATYSVTGIAPAAGDLVVAIVHTLQDGTIGDPTIPAMTGLGGVGGAATRITTAENLYDGVGGTRARLDVFYRVAAGVGPYTAAVTLGGIVHVGCSIVVVSLPAGTFDAVNPIRSASFDSGGDVLTTAAAITADEQPWVPDGAIVALARNQGSDVIVDDGTFLRRYGGTHTGPVAATDVLYAEPTAPRAASATWAANAAWGMTYVEIRDPAALPPPDPGGAGLLTPTIAGEVYSNLDATAYSTPTFTPAASSILIACVSSEQASLVGDAVLPTLAGHGTWDLIQDNNYKAAGGTRGRMSVWRTKAGASPASAVVTATFAAAQIGCSVTVLQLVGGDLDVTGTRGANAIRNSVQGGSDAVRSIQASLDEPVWTLDGTLAFIVHQANEPIGPATGYTVLAYGGHAGPPSAQEAIWDPAGPAAASATWATTAAVGLVVLEIRDLNAVAPGGGGTTTGHPWIDIVNYSTSRRLRPTAPFDPQYTGSAGVGTEPYNPSVDTLEQIVGRQFNGQRLYHDVGMRIPAPQDPPAGGQLGGGVPAPNSWYETASDLDTIYSTGPPAPGTGPHVFGDPGNLYARGHRIPFISLHSRGGSDTAYDWTDIANNVSRPTQHAPAGETAEAYFKWIGNLILSETMARYRFYFAWHHEPENDVGPLIGHQGIALNNVRADFAPAFINIIDWWAEIGLVPRTVDPTSPLLSIGIHLLRGTFSGGQHGPVEAWLTPALAAKIQMVGSSAYSRWDSNLRAKSMMDPIHTAALAMTGAPWNLAAPLKCFFGEFGCAERYVEATTAAQQPTTLAQAAAMTPTTFKADFFDELRATLKGAVYNNNAIPGEPDVEFISLTDHWAIFSGNQSAQHYPLDSTPGTLAAVKRFLNDTTTLDGTHTIFGVPLTSPEVDAWSDTANPTPDPPVVTSFSPTAGPAGTTVTITGTDFSGATSVEFGGIATSSFSVTDPQTIVVTVPATAVDGPITVVGPGGQDDSPASFDVTTATPQNPPAVTSFSPPSGPVGTAVTLTGTAFTGATAVRFGALNASAFVVTSDTQIVANVPSGAVDAVITVVSALGQGSSPTAFDVTAPPAPGGGDIPSVFNPTADLTTDVMGIWLIDGETETPDESITRVYLEGQEPSPAVIGESGATLTPLGRASPMYLRESIRGYEDRVTGVATSRADRRAVEAMMTPAGRRVRLVMGDLNIPVQLSNLAVARFPTQRGLYTVSFDVQQVGEFAVESP